MIQEIKIKLKILQLEIHSILANRLTYPKSILALLLDRPITEDELERSRTYIDQSIKQVDLKFIEFLSWMEEKTDP